MAGSKPSDYDMGIDPALSREGKPSAFIQSKVADVDGFGTIMQMFQANDYRRKRMQISAYVKAENIQDWAGLWMRIDGPDANDGGSPLGFDNMGNRPIKGTSDWQQYSIVLDVPEEAVNIAFGLLLHGDGKAWLNDFRFEEVSWDVPTTGAQNSYYPPRPVNLDFTEGD